MPSLSFWLPCSRPRWLAQAFCSPSICKTCSVYPALETGLIMLPGAVLGAIMGFFAGRLFDKLGVRRIVIPGALVAAIGGCGLVGFGLDTPVPFIIVIYTCLGVGMQALVTRLTPGESTHWTTVLSSTRMHCRTR